MKKLVLHLTIAASITAISSYPVSAQLADNPTQQHNSKQSQTIKHSKESAKEYGLIGELPNGFVGYVNGAYKSPQLDDLIKNINKGRMIVYKAAAKKKRLPVEYIQAKAADQLYKSVGPGQYYYTNGSWKQK